MSTNIAQLCAAELGVSSRRPKEVLSNGYGAVSKEVFADALRDYQAALDSMRSPQRDEGEEFQKRVAR